MALAYITYTIGVFHFSWALRSSLAALVLFFLVHVPLLWGLLGTGAVSETEYFIYYPMAACAAALLGFLYAWRLNNRAVIGPMMPACPRLGDHWRQWTSVVKHSFLVSLLVVAPALPLELYTRNTFVGGIVSLLTSALVHVLYWLCARRSPSVGDTAVQRRTFFIWNAIFDLFLRTFYTVPHMAWSDFRFTIWPLYATLASIAFAIVPMVIVLELVFLRPSEPRPCARGHECYRCAPRHVCACGSSRCTHLVAATQPALIVTPGAPPCPSLCSCSRCAPPLVVAAPAEQQAQLLASATSFPWLQDSVTFRVV